MNSHAMYVYERTDMILPLCGVFFFCIVSLFLCSFHDGTDERISLFGIFLLGSMDFLGFSFLRAKGGFMT